jgi:hypothetical protein
MSVLIGFSLAIWFALAIGAIAVMVLTIYRITRG